MADGAHVPVLLAEAVESLAIHPAGVYVDATFGRGGHARSILAALGPHGRLVAVDRDPAAEASAGAIHDSRFAFCRAWFSELPDVLASLRMDPARGESAAEFIARASVRELTEVIRDYGEERFAQSVARAIAAARAIAPVVSTAQLASIVGQAVGARTRGDWRQNPAARTFQALRIAVNRELHELSITLPRLAALLAPRGRLAVISFHSLEDRIVKRFFAWASTPWGGDPRLARVPVTAAALPRPPLSIVGRARKAGEAEISANPRARSAVMRVCERTPAALPADWPRGFEDAA